MIAGTSDRPRILHVCKESVLSHARFHEKFVLFHTKFRNTTLHSKLEVLERFTIYTSNSLISLLQITFQTVMYIAIHIKGGVPTLTQGPRNSRVEGSRPPPPFFFFFFFFFAKIGQPVRIGTPDSGLVPPFFSPPAKSC